MISVEEALQTQWGRLFRSYGDGEVVMPGMEPKTVITAAAATAAVAALAGLGIWALTRKKK